MVLNMSYSSLRGLLNSISCDHVIQVPSWSGSEAAAHPRLVATHRRGCVSLSCAKHTSPLTSIFAGLALSHPRTSVSLPVPPKSLTMSGTKTDNGASSVSIVEAREGEKVVLLCAASAAKPPPRIKWFRKHIELLPGKWTTSRNDFLTLYKQRPHAPTTTRARQV